MHFFFAVPQCTEEIELEEKCDANGISRIKHGGLYKDFEMTIEEYLIGKNRNPGTRNKQPMQAVKDNSRGIFKKWQRTVIKSIFPHPTNSMNLAILYTSASSCCKGWASCLVLIPFQASLYCTVIS